MVAGSMRARIEERGGSRALSLVISRVTWQQHFHWLPSLLCPNLFSISLINSVHEHQGHISHTYLRIYFFDGGQPVAIRGRDEVTKTSRSSHRPPSFSRALASHHARNCKCCPPFASLIADSECQYKLEKPDARSDCLHQSPTLDHGPLLHVAWKVSP